MSFRVVRALALVRRQGTRGLQERTRPHTAAPVTRKKGKARRFQKWNPKKQQITNNKKTSKYQGKPRIPPPSGRYIKHLPPRTEQVIGTGLTGTGKAIATKHRPGKHEARQATKHRPAARVRQLPLKHWQPGTGKASRLNTGRAGQSQTQAPTRPGQGITLWPGR